MSSVIIMSLPMSAITSASTRVSFSATTWSPSRLSVSKVRTPVSARIPYVLVVSMVPVIRLRRFATASTSFSSCCS